MEQTATPDGTKTVPRQPATPDLPIHKRESPTCRASFPAGLRCSLFQKSALAWQKVGISLAEAKRANPDENGVFRSSEQPNKINDLNVAADRLTPAGPTVE
jgi:hypothetical protein